MHRRTVCVLALVCATLLASGPAGTVLRLSLRSRVELFKGSGDWQAVQVSREIPTARAALVICDMWDRHWCKGATSRVEVLARKAAPLVDLARERGVLIIHAPSDTMAYYKDNEARIKLLAIPKLDTPQPLTLTDPPLPIDDSDGGCDTGDPVNIKAWTRQHPAIHVSPNDLISDNGREVYSALKLRGIDTLLVMGVHTNMCVLGRSFAIRQMTKWGVHCILIRDLTDSMYNPARRPFVSHDQGTQLVIEHIEKYWAPTVTSDEFMRALNSGRS